MRQANRSLSCPTRVRTLFVEPLEDRLVLSSITPASTSPSVLAHQQDEIASIVPIDAQRDAARSNNASNSESDDATPDDDYDYDEPTTPNSASDASGESAETIDESSESPGEVYPENRDARSSYATAQMDAMKKYEAEFFGPNPYEQPLMANPAIAQQVDIVSSTASRQSSTWKPAG